MWRVLLQTIWSPCWLGHEPLVYERDVRGRLILVCPRCRHTHVVDLRAV